MIDNWDFFVKTQENKTQQVTPELARQNMESQDVKRQVKTSFENSPAVPVASATKLNEAEIWKKFKKGDESAFIWIYKNYFGVLCNFARQFDLDDDAVKDQIQELFIYIRNNRTRLADVQSVKFYLFTSLRRRILANKKRKYSLISLFSLNSKSGFEIEVGESHEVKLINQSLNSEIKERLSNSMSKLTLRQKEAVLHFFYEGMSYKEIAEIMELKKVKSARKLIYRAIESLRKELHTLKSTF